MMGRARGAIKTRLAAAFFAAGLASAASAEAPRATLELLPGFRDGDGGRVAALRIALAPGWKTYWRNPGDAGVPPTFDWSGSGNVAAVSVEWPTPEVADSFGFATIGYTGEVILPLRVEARDPSAPIALRLGLDFGVCAEVCVPERADLALDIAPAAPDRDRAEIESALARRPTPARAGGVAAATCGMAGAGADRLFEAALRFDGPAPAPRLAVVEGPDGVWFGSAQTVVEGDRVRVRAEARLADPAAWVGRDALRVTLFGDGLGATGALDLDGCGGAG
jgi:DsbC/DsbD-like thiol-disulfide interchange protein